MRLSQCHRSYPKYRIINSLFNRVIRPKTKKTFNLGKEINELKKHVIQTQVSKTTQQYDYVIKWKHFPRHWPFARGVHRPPMNSPCKGQWRGALMCSLICAWINGCVNNREASDMTRHRAHYDVTLMKTHKTKQSRVHILWDILYMSHVYSCCCYWKSAIFFNIK